MKLVIDISNERYNKIKGCEDNVTDYNTTLALYCAVRDGTPIDNAQTVEISETISKFRNTAYQNGFTTGLNKRLQGEWIDHSSENLLWGHNECPFCHKRSNKDASYCQYCGADMRGEKND